MAIHALMTSLGHCMQRLKAMVIAIIMDDIQFEAHYPFQLIM